MSITVCLFVCKFVTLYVTDFSAGDKASGVKFGMMVHGRPGHGISYFGELCYPIIPKSDQSAPVLKIYSSQNRAPYLRAVVRTPWTPRGSAPVLLADLCRATVRLLPSYVVCLSYVCLSVTRRDAHAQSWLPILVHTYQNQHVTVPISD